MVTKDKVPVRIADSLIGEHEPFETEALVFTTPDGYIYFNLIGVKNQPLYRFDFEVRIKSV